MNSVAKSVDCTKWVIGLILTDTVKSPCDMHSSSVAITQTPDHGHICKSQLVDAKSVYNSHVSVQAYHQFS